MKPLHMYLQYNPQMCALGKCCRQFLVLLVNKCNKEDKGKFYDVSRFKMKKTD